MSPTGADSGSNDPILRTLAAYLVDLSVSKDEGSSVGAQGTLRSDFPGFEGHFPGRPLLAGAFQLEMLALLARLLLPDGWKTRTVQHARFRRMLRPGDQVHLEASLQKTGNRQTIVKATLHAQSGRACQTTFTFSRG